MPQAKQQHVKVSGKVKPAVHARLTKIAERAHSTIGAIVPIALDQFISNLKSNPEALAVLPRDGRRPAA